MHEAALSYEAPVIIELGTRSGNSASAWLAAIEKKDGHGHLWSVDQDEPVVPPAWRELPYWTFMRGDDRDEEVIRLVREGTYPGADILFIDTSHYYRHTLAELDAYVPMVRDGGMVIMHDTEWQACEVAKALDEWCPAHGLEWENRHGCNGLGVIRVTEERS